MLKRLPAGKMFFIELKSGPEIIAPLVKILSTNNVPVERLRLLAFDPQLIAAVKKALPGMRVCLNLDYRWNLGKLGWQPSRAEIVETLERIGADGLSSQAHMILNAPLIAELQRSAKEVHVWTVDSVRTARRYNGMEVDSIMTNRPGWLRSRLMKGQAERSYR